MQKTTPVGTAHSARHDPFSGASAPRLAEPSKPLSMNPKNNAGRPAFAEFLLATFGGQEALSAGVGVLDVAGGASAGVRARRARPEKPAEGGGSIVRAARGRRWARWARGAGRGARGAVGGAAGDAVGCAVGSAGRGAQWARGAVGAGRGARGAGRGGWRDGPCKPRGAVGASHLRQLSALPLGVLVQCGPSLEDLEACRIMRLIGATQQLQLAVGAQLRPVQLGLQPLRCAEHGSDHPRGSSWWVGGGQRRCAASSSICYLLRDAIAMDPDECL